MKACSLFRSCISIYASLKNITKHILMGISFAKGVERPITVMGIEKKIQVSVGWMQRLRFSG